MIQRGYVPVLLPLDSAILTHREHAFVTVPRYPGLNFALDRHKSNPISSLNLVVIYSFADVSHYAKRGPNRLRKK